MGLGGRRPLAGTDDLRGSPHDDVTVGGKPPSRRCIFMADPPPFLLRRRRPSATARGQCFSCHHANHCPSPRLFLKNMVERCFFTLWNDDFLSSDVFYFRINRKTMNWQYSKERCGLSSEKRMRPNLWGDVEAAKSWVAAVTDRKAANREPIRDRTHFFPFSPFN